MGSYSRNHHPARRQRIRSFATGRQRMGVDVDRVPAFSRIPFLPLLSRLLGSLLRWQTLCAEGGVDGGVGPVKLGDIEIVDEPDTPCAATQAVSAEIYAAG